MGWIQLNIQILVGDFEPQGGFGFGILGESTLDIGSIQKPGTELQAHTSLALLCRECDA